MQLQPVDLQVSFNIDLNYGATHTAVFAGSAVWMKILCSPQIETISEGFVLLYEQTKLAPGKNGWSRGISC
jgi:hypothetical protein